MTPRQRAHNLGVAYAAAELRARRCVVEVVTVNWGVALIVTPPGGRSLEVAVRVAHQRVARHPVTVNGRHYVYRYPILHWNLHSHGARTTAPDAWVLVALGSPRRAFVVPGEVLRSKTVMLLDTPSARQGRSRIRAYSGRWEIIAGRAGRRAA